MCIHILIPCFITIMHVTIVLVILIQAVYNANKFARAVKKRQKLQNYLDYNELKFERSPHKRPTKKVALCS